MQRLQYNSQRYFSAKVIDINSSCTKIYGVLYNQASSIAFDETSSYWSVLKKLLISRLFGLKTLLLQGLSEPEFYGDLVYKFRKIIGKIDFPYHFKKIIVRYKKIGYNINVMRQTACLVVNPIKVNSFAYLFNCTTVGRTSD